MIEFKKLRYKNFLSFGNQFQEIDLNTSKTTLIVGTNGSGKSTLIDALSFALFNKPFRNINKPQLVNSINGKHLLVEVEFQINKKRYKIVRGIKPAIFEIYENDKLINQDSANRDYQEYLEKYILKINHRTFCQVVVLGTASFTPFMNLVPAHRREIVENILDLKIFSLMNSLLKNKMLELDEKVNQNTLEKRLLEQKIELTNKHNEQLDATTKKVVQEKKDRIKQARENIAASKKRIDEQTKELNECTKKYINYRKLQKKEADLLDVKERIEAKVGKIKKTIKFFHDETKCPTCSQKIDEQFKVSMVAKKEDSLKETEAALDKLQLKLDYNHQEWAAYEKLDDIISDLRLEQNTLTNQIKTWERYIEELNKEISGMQIEGKKENVKKLQKQLDVLTEEYQSLLDQRNLLEYSGLLLKDSGIKARIIKQYIPIINKLINKYLSMLDFFVDFQINEEFVETIRSRYRDEFSYNSFSEGEKFRINLAVLFTWRAIAKMRNSISTNILFMDEVMDSSLDVSGTEEFMKIISQISEENNIFIISHKVDQLFDKFENVMKFEKVKNFSRLVVQ